MILIGQYDSPFVRRVAIALRRYGIAFEHRPWSVFADAEKIAEYNPLRRVPTLVLDDGTVFGESWAIVDVIDEMAGPERALLPPRGPVRRDGLRIAALATGFADKSVSLYLETALRTSPSGLWIARCKDQMADALDELDADRARRSGAWWLGDAISHADIAVTCALGHAREAHPKFFDAARWPALAAHVEQCNALDDFRVVYQPFIVKFAD
jgi:glutathione S-transferase